MRRDTVDQVDAWWRGLFGLDRDDLWQRVTVQHPHGDLGDYPGWYVAWRDAGVHVSAPSTAEADEVASLRSAAGPDLQEPEFWHAFGRQRGLELRGPATHTYLDEDPGPAPGVVDLVPADLEPLRAGITEHEWELHTDGATHLVGVEEEGRLVAAASLGAWHGVARDIGVVVVPDRRGRGLAQRVGRTCASYAIREHGYALWRSLTTNVASLRAAERLGFEPFATQLALRPTPTSDVNADVTSG